MLKGVKKSAFIICPVLVTAIALCLNVLRYGAFDDILMYHISNSYAFNSHSEFLTFINVGLGYVLKLLYGFAPAVNWFSLLYITAINLGFISLHRICQKHTDSLAPAVILSLVEFYLLLRLSFSSISFILLLTAVLWMLDNVDKLEAKKIGHIIYSLFLFALALGMRNGMTVYCVIAICIPLFLFAIIKKRNHTAVVALIVVLAIGANIGVTALNRGYKANIPADMYYNEFQEYRCSASDEGKINYKAHKDEFKQAGISKNDLKLFKQFVYGDKEAFSAEKLKAISEARSFEDKYNTNPIKIIKNVIKLESIPLNYIFYFAAFAVILFILFKKKRLELFASTAFVAAAELYLFVRRRGVFRVTDPIAALGIIILLYIVLDEKESLKELSIFKKIEFEKAAKAVTAILLVFTVLASAACVKAVGNKYKDYSDITEVIQQDKEHIYLAAPLSADNIYDQHLTLTTAKYNKVPVYAIEGDWWIYSYYWHNLTEELGLSEYKDKAINSILDDRVLFVSRNKDLPDYLVKLYKEHYGLNVRYRLVEKYSGKMKVYDFYIVE